VSGRKWQGIGGHAALAAEPRSIAAVLLCRPTGLLFLSCMVKGGAWYRSDLGTDLESSVSPWWLGGVQLGLRSRRLYVLERPSEMSSLNQDLVDGA
jgi:hypothetical protein